VVNWIVFYGVRFFSKEQSLLSSVCQQKVNGRGAHYCFGHAFFFLLARILSDLFLILALVLVTRALV
jgi:hypothetical protein